MTPWLLAVLMAVAGLLFVLPPWLRRGAPTGRSAQPDRAATLKALHRSRRAELAADAEQGLLGPDDLAAAEQELDSTLLRELDALQDAVVTERSAEGPAWPVALLLAGVALAGSLALYARLGEPQAPLLADAQALLELEATDTAELRRWYEVLSDRVARRPQDAKSRYLLGHVALKQQRYSAAADAFAAAARAHGRSDPNIELYLLQARFLAADGRLDEPTRQLAERLIQQRPGMPALYEVLVIDAFNRQDFKGAVTVLNRALAQQLGPAQRASFQSALAQARTRLGLPGAADTVPTPGAAGGGERAAAAGPAIDVTIKGLAAVPAERTLFVIARPPGGGMPYAVVRRPGPDFPDQVRLDDLVSMNPAAPLSTAPAVEVIVRASVTGTATRSPDDWQWSSPTLSFADGQTRHALVAELAPPEAG
ncbi:MAG: c-type cytochrome biogenesis protein CcmI [Pseudomonadota bacterium]